jgi:hypothetical protein
MIVHYSVYFLLGYTCFGLPLYPGANLPVPGMDAMTGFFILPDNVVATARFMAVARALPWNTHGHGS